MEGGGALGGEFGACGALVGEPQADGEAFDLHGVGCAQVAVLGGVGTGVSQAACEPRGGSLGVQCRLRFRGHFVSGPAFGPELGDRCGPVGRGDSPHALCLRLVPGAGAYAGAYPGVQRACREGTEAIGDPRPLKAPGQFVDEAGDIGQRVRLVPSRVSEQLLLHARVGQDRGQGDGFGIGHRVPRRGTPCGVIAVGYLPQPLGPEGFFRPGFVPP